MNIRRLACVAAVVALSGAACGTDEEAPAAPETTPEVTPEPTPEVRTYVVQPGDNLFRIAERHDTTVDAIVEANDIPNPDLIHTGQELVIPPP